MRSLLVGLTAAFMLAGLAPGAAQSCNASSFSGSYGAVDVLPGTSVDTTATFSLSCTGTANSTVRVCIDVDDGGSSPRKLTSGANTLTHELYSNAARTAVWGAWGIAGAAYSTSGVQLDLPLGAGGSATTNLTVYGRIAASQQTTIPGSYSWSSASPDLQYGYAAGTACPTGGSIAAQGGSSTMTATVNANATLTILNINFGASGVLSAAITANGRVTVKATNTTPYAIGIGPGNGPGATVTNRLMSAGGSTVIYSLYQNSGRTTVWGDTAGTNTVSKTGTGINQATTVYGRVPAQNSPAPGSYADSVVVTVTF